jgi:hypothetical protein
LFTLEIKNPLDLEVEPLVPNPNPVGDHMFQVIVKSECKR